MGWFGHNHMPVEGRTILLTGSSEGAGLSAARIFSSRGANVIIVSRSQAKLDGAIKSIKAEAKLWLRRNGAKQPSTTPQSRPAAKHIIFTGTVLSMFSLAGHGTYTPSKFALRALADALVMEVRLYPDVPIEVHLVLPNSITTAGYERENATKPQITHELGGPDTPQSADEVASMAISGIEKGRYFIATSFVGNMMRWAAMGNSPRDNWFVDMLMSSIVPFVILYITWYMMNVVSSWAKKNKQS